MLMFAALATVLVLAPSALAQICLPGRVGNVGVSGGCSNFGGDGVFFTTNSKCLRVLTDPVACKTAGGVLIGVNELGSAGAYANLIFCSPLLLGSVNDGKGNAFITLSAKYDGTSKYLDATDGTTDVTANVPSTIDKTGCAKDSFVNAKIVLATGEITYSCTSSPKFICVTSQVGAPDIDAAWSSWQTSPCFGDCGTKTGVQRKVRLCNNPATTANNGKNTCTGTNVGTATTINGVLTDVQETTGCTVPGCSVAVSIGGANFNSYFSFLNSPTTVDTFVPVAGQVCTNTITALSAPLRNPYLFLDKDSKLWACGSSNGVLQCQNLDLTKSPPAWATAVLASNDRPNHNLIYIPTLSAVVLCGLDKYSTTYTPAEFFDPSASAGLGAWSSKNYPLPLLDILTDGGSGCVVQDNYLYVFGGKRVDTLTTNTGLIAARLLLIKNAAGVFSPWEILLRNVPQNVVNPSVFANPSYANQLFVIPEYSTSQGTGAAYIYDITTNILASTSIGSSVVYEGIDFGRACTNPNIYGLGGAGTYLLTPSTAISTSNPIFQPSGALTSITGVPTPTRSNAAYVMVPFASLSKASLPASCIGC